MTSEVRPSSGGVRRSVIASCLLRALYVLLCKFKACGLVTLLALASSGCCTSHWCHFPDDCADALCHSQLGWELQDICCEDAPACCPSLCESNSCDEPCCMDECCDGYCDESCCVRTRKCRVEPGPPPVRYQPPMPPKFLPVPARSVFSTVNMQAPTIQRGQIEMDYGPQISFPSGD